MRRLLLPLLIGMANEDDVAVTDVALLICGPPAGDFGPRPSTPSTCSATSA